MPNLKHFSLRCVTASFISACTEPLVITKTNCKYTIKYTTSKVLGWRKLYFPSLKKKMFYESFMDATACLTCSGSKIVHKIKKENIFYSASWLCMLYVII